MVEKVILVGLELTVFVVFIDDVLEGVQCEEGDLTGLDLLLDFGEAGFKIVNKEKLCLFLVLLTLAHDVAKSIDLLLPVLVIIGSVEILQILTHLLVGLDV